MTQEQAVSELADKVSSFFFNYDYSDEGVGHVYKDFTFCINNDDDECEWEFDVYASFDVYMTEDGAGQTYYDTDRVDVDVMKAYHYIGEDEMENIFVDIDILRKYGLQ